MRFLLGPELFWLLFYALAQLIARANTAPLNSMDSVVEKSWFWVPVASLLVFGLWWLPPVEKNWLLLRVWIAGLVGAHFVIERLLTAYSTQGPGVGMGYLAGLCLQFATLVAGSIFVKIKF